MMGKNVNGAEELGTERRGTLGTNLSGSKELGTERDELCLAGM